MQVVVADATPLHYLILIGAIQVLLGIFEKIHVPVELRHELTCEARPPGCARLWGTRRFLIFGRLTNCLRQRATF